MPHLPGRTDGQEKIRACRWLGEAGLRLSGSRVSTARPSRLLASSIADAAADRETPPGDEPLILGGHVKVIGISGCHAFESVLGEIAWRVHGSNIDRPAQTIQSCDLTDPIADHTLDFGFGSFGRAKNPMHMPRAGGRVLMYCVGIERSELPSLLVPLIGIPPRNSSPNLPEEGRRVVRVDTQATEVDGHEQV